MIRENNDFSKGQLWGTKKKKRREKNKDAALLGGINRNVGEKRKGSRLTIKKKKKGQREMEPTRDCLEVWR